MQSSLRTSGQSIAETTTTKTTSCETTVVSDAAVHGTILKTIQLSTTSSITHDNSVGFLVSLVTSVEIVTTVN